MEILIMGNKSKRGGRNGGFRPQNRIQNQFANQSVPLKLPEAPDAYPEWLKSVYKDLQVAVNAARRDPSLNVHDVMALLQLSNLICDYVYYSATHFAEISNADIDKMKDVNVIKALVDQFKKQRDEILEGQKMEEGEASPEEEKQEVQSQEQKE